MALIGCASAQAFPSPFKVSSRSIHNGGVRDIFVKSEKGAALPIFLQTMKPRDRQPASCIITPLNNLDVCDDEPPPFSDDDDDDTTELITITIVQEESEDEAGCSDLLIEASRIPPGA